MGGVDDMSVWTRLVWDLSLSLAANGTEDCYIPKNPMNIDCSRKHSGNLEVRNENKKMKKVKIFDRIEKAYGEKLEILSKKFIQAESSLGGMTFQSSKKPTQSINQR